MINLLPDVIRPLFVLPPLEIREKRAPYFYKLLDKNRGESLEDNYSYLKYIMARNGVILSAIVGFVFILVAVLKPDIIFYMQERIYESQSIMILYETVMQTKSMVISYAYVCSFIVGMITIYLLLPYYLMLFLINVDMKKTDLLRAHYVYRYKRNRTLKNKVKLIALFSSGIFFVIMGLFWTYLAMYVVADLFDVIINLYNTYLYLIISYIGIILFQFSGSFLLVSIPILIYLLSGYDKYGGITTFIDSSVAKFKKGE